MDLLKAQLNRIQQQLAGLSASQKMLTGTLVAIMIMTMVMWARYAGDSEMVPVLDQAMATEDIGQITSYLQAKGIHYTTSGDRILVPSELRMGILGELGFAQLLPHDTRNAFDEMIKQIGTFDDSTKTEAMYNQAKQTTLAQIIRTFPGVAKAFVEIDPTSHRSLEHDVQPTASITIFMKDASAAANKKLANAVADLVIGAQAGLSKSLVHVIINGCPCRVQDDEPDSVLGGASNLLEIMETCENRYERKVLDQFPDIHGMTVAVKVSINNKSVKESKSEIDQKNSFHAEQQVQSETTETNTPQPSGDTGVGPNTGITTAGPPAQGATSNNEKNQTNFMNVPAVKRTDTNSPGGDPTVVSATVRVPRSYFVSEFKGSNPSTKDPSDTELRPVMEAKLAEMKQSVKSLTGIASDDAIAMATYSDSLPMLMGTLSETGGGAAAVVPALTSHSKEIALGGLAVVSLFMVSMIVRKSAPAPVVAVAVEPQIPVRLGEAMDVAGEAGDGGQTMDGMELDEDAARTQQMVSQVERMVADNPDAAANLVKRWLNRS